MDAARLLQELRELQADAERIVRRTSAILESLGAGEVDSPVRDDRAADLQPWERIESIDKESELAREIVRLREQERLTAIQISERLLRTHGVQKTPQVIYNTLSALRRDGYSLPDRRKNPIRSEID